MGFASSSAARVEDALPYGILGGMGTPRKLKKVPVLVLDADELARAHELFQQGAAEQLGEFDPQQRVARATPILSLATAHGAAPDDDASEDDLPLPDFAAVLALTRMREAAEEQAPAHIVAPATPPASDRATIMAPAQRPASEASPSPEPSANGALARIINRAAAQPRAILPPTDSPTASPTPPLVGFEPAGRAEPAPAREPEGGSPAPRLRATRTPASEPLDLPTTWTEPARPAQLERPSRAIRTFDELDAVALPEPPKAPEQMPINAAPAAQNQLRARIQRDDAAAARRERPAPDGFAATLRRWWGSLVG